MTDWRPVTGCSTCSSTMGRLGCPVHSGRVPDAGWTAYPVAPPDGRRFGPCAKCGGSDLLVEWHDGQRVGQGWWPMCERSRECGGRGAVGGGVDGEHLRVHCRRCQWGWREPVGTVVVP